MNNLANHQQVNKQVKIISPGVGDREVNTQSGHNTLSKMFKFQQESTRHTEKEEKHHPYPTGEKKVGNRNGL